MRTALIMALFVGLSTVSPLLSAKVIAGVIPAGMISGCLAYGLVDVLNAVAGRRTAAQVVDATAITRLVVYGLVLAVALAPPISSVPIPVRVFAAGTLGAWFAMRVVNIPLFAWLRGPFWQRYSLTSVPSQTVALVIWVPLAYAGTGANLAAIVAGGFLLRVIMSVALTPLFSWLAAWTRRGAVVAACALALVSPVSAADWKLDNQLRLLWANTPALPGRGEAITTLRFMPLPYLKPWANNLLVVDFSGARSIVNDKLTVGVEVWGGLSPVYQVQWVTKMATAQRVGIEWRLSLP